MITLNEQIQRLRDVLVTCYKAIKDKGGTIPEAGERNMSNLPAAVLSIPQSHGELTELTVTANGEYLPQEGVDGFSKVVANVVPTEKVKLTSLPRITNECVDENGSWAAELLDTSLLTSFGQLFQNVTNLKRMNTSEWDTSNVTDMFYMFSGSSIEDIDVSGWRLPKLIGMENAFYSTKIKTLNMNNWNANNVTTMYTCFASCSLLESLDLSNWRFNNPVDARRLFKNCTSLKQVNLMNFYITDGWEMFSGCINLETVDVSNWDASELLSTEVMFVGCSSLQQLDMTNWNVEKLTSIGNMFSGCVSLTTLIGDRTIEDVLRDEIRILNGLTTGNFINFAPNVNTASILALVNGLAGLTEQTRQTLTLGRTIGARLDKEQIAGMPAKDYLASKAGEKYWTIAY